jgi:hypothetical protein
MSPPYGPNASSQYPCPKAAASEKIKKSEVSKPLFMSDSIIGEKLGSKVTSLVHLVKYKNHLESSFPFFKKLIFNN